MLLHEMVRTWTWNEQTDVLISDRMLQHYHFDNLRTVLAVESSLRPLQYNLPTTMSNSNNELAHNHPHCHTFIRRSQLGPCFEFNHFLHIEERASS